MNELQILIYSGNEIRTVKHDGATWWVLKDVCDALELSNASMIANRLDDDERAKFNLGRQGEATIVSESGLYNVILRSDKPQAKDFKRWVTHDVLPAIRKTGSYSMQNPRIERIAKAREELKRWQNLERRFSELTEQSGKIARKTRQQYDENRKDRNDCREHVKKAAAQLDFYLEAFNDDVLRSALH